MRQALATNASNNKAKPARSRRTRAAKPSSTMTAVNVPVETAYVIRQRCTKSSHVERGSEYIGQWSMGNNTQVGQVTKFDMNPIKLFGSRLRMLSLSYQKYRFRKMSIRVQSSAATSITGLYLAGYSSNPDFEINAGSAFQQIYALPDAVSANTFRSVVCPAQIEDRNKWYLIDEDSEEIMQTTQGCFYITAIQPTNSTVQLVYPIILDYEIEFVGNAIQATTIRAPFVWPAGTWAYSSLTGNFTFTPNAGETPGPVIAVGQSFEINPEYTVTVSGEETTIGVIRGTTASWEFFENVEDLQTNTQVQIKATFTSARTIGQIVGPN